MVSLRLIMYAFHDCSVLPNNRVSCVATTFACVYRAAGYIVDCLWALLKLFEDSRVCSIGTTSDTFSSNAHLLGMIPSSTLNQKPSVSGGGNIFLKLPYFFTISYFLQL